MTPKNLLSSWMLPDRSTERVQLTLRLPFNDYARLRALKEVYPRSVNEMICDIIKVGLDEIVEALPSRPADEEDVYELNGRLDPDLPSSCYFKLGDSVGPAVDFENAYHRILRSKSDEDAKETVE